MREVIKRLSFDLIIFMSWDIKYISNNIKDRKPTAPVSLKISKKIL